MTNNLRAMTSDVVSLSDVPGKKWKRPDRKPGRYAPRRRKLLAALDIVTAEDFEYGYGIVVRAAAFECDGNIFFKILFMKLMWKYQRGWSPWGPVTFTRAIHKGRPYDDGSAREFACAQGVEEGKTYLRMSPAGYNEMCVLRRLIMRPAPELAEPIAVALAKVHLAWL